MWEPAELRHDVAMCQRKSNRLFRVAAVAGRRIGGEAREQFHRRVLVFQRLGVFEGQVKEPALVVAERAIEPARNSFARCSQRARISASRARVIPAARLARSAVGRDLSHTSVSSAVTAKGR